MTWHPPMVIGFTPPENMITEQQFNAIAKHAAKNAAGLFVPYINQYAKQYGIDTADKMAAFMAQVTHESGHFKYAREIWGPTAQQQRYERDINKEWKANLPVGHRNKLAYDLGNSQPGDGKYFMGRGCIQTTGRSNYNKVSIHLFGDDRLLHQPQLLEVPEYSIRAAMHYFSTRVMNKVADITDVVAVTKKINGGTNGLAERKELYQAATQALA